MIYDSCKALGGRAGFRRSIIVPMGLFVGLVSTATSARGDVVSINPSDDSYVRLRSSSNYGGDSGMYVGEYPIPATPYRIQRPYLKFDLSAVPADKEIRSATLWVYCTSTYGGTVDVGAHYLDCDDWVENGIVGEGAPTAYGETATDAITLVPAVYNAWAVTRDVRIAYYGDGEYGVVLKLASEGTGPVGALLVSKEGGTQPYLEIQYEDGGLDTVVCEPQGGGNPTHPATYWYDVTPGAFGRCDFHVRVYDRNPVNYTNWNLPAGTWQFRVHPVGDNGDEWWASWWDPGCTNAIFGSFTFQFDNSNASTWGDWTTTIDGTSNAYEQVVDSSWSHTADSNGYGYLVHVPANPSTYVVKPNGTGDFATIQAAIDAAWDGDTIELTDGTFTGAGNRDIDFRGKAITVRSQSGNPASCIIDCQGSEANPRRGFYFHKGEGADSVVEGITTTNGYGAITTNGADGWVRDDGGGLLCDSCSSPALVNCVFSGNTTEDDGGGMACEDSSSPTVDGCVFSANSAPSGHGGGVCCGADCEAAFTDCTLFFNTSGDDGAGIAAFASVSVKNCTFAHNKTQAHGGGMTCMGADATLHSCSFYGNETGTSGAGFSGFVFSGELVNCLFSGNATDGDGGGVIFGNDSFPTISDCTFSGNSAAGNGGGIAVTWDSEVWVDNSIIAFSTNGEGVWCETAPDPGWANLQYTDVYGNAGGDWVGCIAGQANSNGNICADPLFVDSNGSDDTYGTTDDDLRLLSGSPCIDTGSNGLLPSDSLDLDDNGNTTEAIPLDLDLHPRVLCEIVDMGAYESGIGDYDCDGDVDLDDFAYWDGCMTGPNGGPYSSGCEAFDWEFDGDVDLIDFGEFQKSFGD